MTIAQWPEQTTQVELEPYLVAGGYPRRLPLLGVTARSSARVGSYEADEEVAAVLSVDLGYGVNKRWVPDPDTYTVSGTDLRWHPSVNVGTSWDLVADGDTAPYIDPAYDYERLAGPELVRPAMMFDGTAFMISDIASHPTTFTVAMVAVLHPNPENQLSRLLSYRNPAAGADLAGTYPMRLQQEGIWLQTYAANTVRTLNYTQRRYPQAPSIICYSSALVAGKSVDRVYVRDRSTANASWTGTKHDYPHSELIIGRSPYAVEPETQPVMELLDLAWWTTALSVPQMANVAARYAKAYGLT